MENALVTVVLPIYNVEKYLSRCIESVVQQTYVNLEILLVDDGSPDRCPELCEKWAQRDSRIRVIHKKNAGLGEARNTGIDHATGDYICFFDSDDYVHPQTIEKCMNRIYQENAQIAVYGVNCVNHAGKITVSYPPAVGARTYRGNAVQNEFLPEFTAPTVRKDGQRSFYMSTWVLLYSTSLIREVGWRFVSERTIMSEDVYSLLALFAYVESVTVVPEALYYYCQNGTSLSRKYAPGRYQRILHFYDETMKLCRNLEYSDDLLHRVSKPYLAFTLSAMKQELMSERPVADRLQSVKEIIDDPTLQAVLQQNKNDVVSRNRAIMFFCMRNKLYLFCWVLLLLKS